MQRFTNDGRSAHRNAEEEAPLGLSFEGGVAGARRLSRRQAIGLLGGSLAGASLLSYGLADPAKSQNLPFENHQYITLKCQAVGEGPRFLDGRTHNGSVGLAPHTNPPFTGTKWEVIFVPGKTHQINLYCRGTTPGNRWLDGVTQEGRVALAPTRAGAFTGTYWEGVLVSGTTDQIALKCLGTGLEGNRWLIGHGDGTVGLAPQGGQIAGTRWKVSIIPK
jgi:hypothetical protein